MQDKTVLIRGKQRKLVSGKDLDYIMNSDDWFIDEYKGGKWVVLFVTSCLV